MASVSTDKKSGRRTVQFVATDGKRRSIRLGKVPLKVANSVRRRVECLVAAKLAGHAIDGETARWVGALDEAMHAKLAAVGLVPDREKDTTTLGAFLDRYFASRVDVKGSTKTAWGHTRRNLVEFFGREKPLVQVSPGDADEWRLSLVEQKLSDNTIRRRCGLAKQFFAAAIRHRLIEANPFADLKAAVRANPKRFHFVTRDVAEKVIKACPDAQWRLLFALSRYGGLRCPSEHLGLRWVDIDWDGERIVVHSPKTEHHPGGESRVIPLFPELRTHLEEVWEQAEDGAEFVITRYRDTNANLRTRLLRIIGRAGVEPWPKLFQSLRSTRQTELEESFPSHVVCHWIGNSEKVARMHYLQVTDDHFAKAVQNPVQCGAETARTVSHQEPRNPGKRGVSRGSGISKVGAEGLEPPTSSL